jgi:hypothetical protein
VGGSHRRQRRVTLPKVLGVAAIPVVGYVLWMGGAAHSHQVISPVVPAVQVASKSVPGPMGPQGPRGLRGPEGPAGAEGADGRDGSPASVMTLDMGGTVFRCSRSAGSNLAPEYSCAADSNGTAVSAPPR